MITTISVKRCIISTVKNGISRDRNPDSHENCDGDRDGDGDGYGYGYGDGVERCRWFAALLGTGISI